MTTSSPAMLRSLGMPRTLPAEITYMQPYQRFCVAVTQADSMEVGVNHCVALLEQCFAPGACHVIWTPGRDTRILGPYAARAPKDPTADERLRLRCGELVLHVAGGQVTVCFAPLLARGA